MVYQSLADLLLDNREDLRQKLLSQHASEEALETALTAYDWVACQCLQKSAIEKAYREKYGELPATRENLAAVFDAEKTYMQKALKREYPNYGYSADEEE